MVVGEGGGLRLSFLFDEEDEGEEEDEVELEDSFLFSSTQP